MPLDGLLRIGIVKDIGGSVQVTIIIGIAFADGSVHLVDAGEN